MSRKCDNTENKFDYFYLMYTNKVCASTCVCSVYVSVMLNAIESSVLIRIALRD